MDCYGDWMLISPCVNTFVPNVTRMTYRIPIVATLVCVSLSRNMLIINKMAMAVMLHLYLTIYRSFSKIRYTWAYSITDIYWTFNLLPRRLHLNVFIILSNAHAIWHRLPYGLFPGCSRAVLNKNSTPTHGARTKPVRRRTNFASRHVCSNAPNHIQSDSYAVIGNMNDSLSGRWGNGYLGCVNRPFCDLRESMIVTTCLPPVEIRRSYDSPTYKVGFSYTGKMTGDCTFMNPNPWKPRKWNTACKHIFFIRIQSIVPPPTADRNSMISIFCLFWMIW